MVCLHLDISAEAQVRGDMLYLLHRGTRQGFSLMGESLKDTTVPLSRQQGNNLEGLYPVGTVQCHGYQGEFIKPYKGFENSIKLQLTICTSNVTLIPQYKSRLRNPVEKLYKM